MVKKPQTLGFNKPADNMILSLVVVQCWHHRATLLQVLANPTVVKVLQGDLGQNPKHTERTGSILSFELLRDSTDTRLTR